MTHKIEKDVVTLLSGNTDVTDVTPLCDCPTLDDIYARSTPITVEAAVPRVGKPRSVRRAAFQAGLKSLSSYKPDSRSSNPSHVQLFHTIPGPVGSSC